MKTTRSNPENRSPLQLVLMGAALTVVAATTATAQPTTSPGQSAAAVAAPSPNVRIGISIPSIDIGGTIDGAAEVVQMTLMTFLQGPGLEVVPLEARISTLLIREAQQRRVDYIVTTKLTRKAGGSNLWSTVRRGPASAAMTPGFGAFGDKLGTAVAVGTALQTVSALDEAVNPKDTIELRYSLQKGDGALAHESILEAPATAAGQTTLQALVQRMAVQVVEMIVTGKAERGQQPR